MIPIKADAATLESYVQNVIDVWYAATPEQLAEGRAWYQVANGLATFISDGNTRAGAGVLAALSPMQAWDTNVMLAERAFANGEPSGHLGDALRKAARIMAGEDPLDVLPVDSKTFNFYINIFNPDDADAVTIDRHAHDIVAGEAYTPRASRVGGPTTPRDRGLSKPKRYALIALVYRMAAQRLDELPSTVQAVTWVAWRALHGTS